MRCSLPKISTIKFTSITEKSNSKLTDLIFFNKSLTDIGGIIADLSMSTLDRIFCRVSEKIENRLSINEVSSLTLNLILFVEHGIQSLLLLRREEEEERGCTLHDERLNQ